VTSSGINVRDRLAQAAALHAKLLNLQEERNRIASFVWKAEPREDASNILMSQSVEEFTLKVQSLLEAWKYPGLRRVTFSDEKVDLVISGKERASEGKGFRAIAYAAFMIGLLDYCADSKNELPHPGLVILDSPLVTYKRRDTSPGEAICVACEREAAGNILGEGNGGCGVAFLSDVSSLSSTALVSSALISSFTSCIDCSICRSLSFKAWRSENCELLA
jgi:hypothetical protein